MKAVLMSIHPKWCKMIANGNKTIEVRKNHPKLETPFKVYIYCTNTGGNLVLGDRFDGYGFTTEYTITRGISREKAEKIWGVLNGKVIGEFVCDEVIEIMYDYEDYHMYDISDDDLKDTCLSQEELFAYGKGKPLYSWHISDLVIYDKPKSINDFKKYNRDPENSACSHMPKSFYPDCNVCKECGLTRPPQSWCYIEEASQVSCSIRLRKPLIY